MSVSHALYQLLIGPLELLFEVVFCISKFLFANSGVCIFVLSLTMNVLLLPLYRRADAIQDEERDAQKKMSGWVKHIKKTFSGNERFMMLQAYYRQNNYKPFYALKGMLPLLLEIPFFIAAYHFLSNLEELKGMPFGPIYDLGAPDGLLRLGSLRVNVLPILMTLINCVSSGIYTKGLPAKDKLQLYGMALVFLVLLYTSPSGLVIYWTLNNLFSLLKNLYYKLKNPKRVLRIGLAIAGVALIFYTLLFYETDYVYSPLFLYLIAAAMLLPLVLHLLGKKIRFKRSPGSRIPEQKNHKAFFLGCLFLTVLTGALIPSAVIESSPAEFVFPAAFRAPAWHVADALLLAAGMFLVWFGIFYFLANKRAKWVFGLLILVFSGFGVVNYMFFGTKLGNLSKELKYDSAPVFSASEIWINCLVVIAIIAVLFFLWKKLQKLTPWIYGVLTVAILALSVMNVSKIQKATPEIREAVLSARETEQKDSREDVQFTLSKEGNNVVVLMLDRAISAYIPYFFQEKPELAQQFDGFTYYPNTLSFGGHTNMGAPALFGGYEYTPEEMNRRSDESLEAKHDESLKVMPTLFGVNGYQVSVFDPPYAGYNWIPNLRIFDDIQQKYGFTINARRTEQGQFNPVPESEQAARLSKCWSRNFFCYSIMKLSPVVMQDVVYQRGNYGSADPYVQTTNGMSRSVGFDPDFMNSYSVLEALPEITRISEGAENTFLMMQNSASHENMLLQEPDYVPARVVDNIQFDKTHTDRFTWNGRTMRMDTERQMSHYQVNMAVLLELGKWFDYLRENGVWDNTRIILVADHGSNLRQFDDLMFGARDDEDVMYYNPLLMVKDFHSTGFTTDNAFMTNADVPTLAFADLVSDPVNPFTDKPINSDAKNAPVQYVFGSHIYQTTKNNGNTFLPGIWYSVHDNILDVNNWEILDEH